MRPYSNTTSTTQAQAYMTLIDDLGDSEQEGSRSISLHRCQHIFSEAY
jgi:hypothetical protein